MSLTIDIGEVEVSSVEVLRDLNLAHVLQGAIISLKICGGAAVCLHADIVDTFVAPEMMDVSIIDSQVEKVEIRRKFIRIEKNETHVKSAK